MYVSCFSFYFNVVVDDNGNAILDMLLPLLCCRCVLVNNDNCFAAVVFLLNMMIALLSLILVAVAVVVMVLVSIWLFLFAVATAAAAAAPSFSALTIMIALLSLW